MADKTNKKTFAALFAVNFLITFSFSVNDTFFPLFFGSYSSSAFTFGLAFSLYSLSKIVFSPFAGKLLDKYGGERVLFGSLILYTAVSCSFYFMRNESLIIAVRIMQGMACAMFRPVLYYLLNYGSQDKRGKTLGIFDLSFYSALAAAPVFGGFLIEWSGFESVFSLMLCCCLGAVAVLLFFKPAAVKRCADKGYDPETGCCGTVNLIMFYIFCRGWGISTVAVFLPLLLYDAGIPVNKTGIILTAATASTAVLLPFTGRLADSVRKENLIISGGFAVSVLLLALPFVKAYEPLLLLMSISGIFSALSQPACSALLLESADKDRLGSTVSRLNLYMGLGFACAPLFGSLIYSAENPHGVFIVSAVLGASASVMFCIPVQYKEVSVVKN